MSYKIQITVDERLSKTIKARAKHMGLSVSSYARLALISALPKNNKKLLEQAIEDVNTHDVESLTLAEFKRQLHDV